MKSKKIQEYQAADDVIPEMQYAWPLYGPGLENLGKNNEPVLTAVPHFAGNELLARVDAVSLCYTDMKEINQAQNHPRLKGRDLMADPIIPGHEVSMTIVGVGQDLQSQYHIGDKITLQPDVWVNGKSIPFCFGMDGGYRQYVKIGREILDGDAGNYLIPIPHEMPYAASAITEPWACVEAAYRMKYRTSLQTGGTMLVWGGDGARQGYQVNEVWLAQNKPAKMILCHAPSDFTHELLSICNKYDIECEEITPGSLAASDRLFDDILLLDASSKEMNRAAALMQNNALLALYNSNAAGNLTFEIDLGRLHYDNILYVGSTSQKIEDAYRVTPARSELKSGGKAWILGAGGPMGRMHLQRAIESQLGPKTIVASEVSDVRLQSMADFFMPLAQKHAKELVLVDPLNQPDEFKRQMDKVMSHGGFDDIEVMVTDTKLISEACRYLASSGVINLFAGVKRGVKIDIDASLFYTEKQVRFVGHSGSGLDDQKAVVERSINGQLKPQLSVAAIGGLRQIHDGVQAMDESRYPGKIVIFPQIFNFPLTALQDLKQNQPDVFEALDENHSWTLEAELRFLEYNL